MLCALEILAPQQNIHIGRVPHGTGIDRRNSGSNRVAIRDGVRDSRGFKRRHRTTQPLPHLFHRKHHPIQKREFFPRLGHATIISRG